MKMLNTDSCRLIAAAALLLAAAGCVTKSAAEAQARAAFLAGQQQATQQMQQAQINGPSVRLLGAVKENYVLWTPDLTLAQALLDAGYYGPEPTEIIVIHNGVATRVDPSKLLHGEDVLLRAQDIIQVK
jgi:hypothetical protein